MSTHTPGPWMWEGDPDDRCELMGAGGDPDGPWQERRLEVLRLAYPTQMTDGDKALIAAAPELLDALRAFCGDYESTPLQIEELQVAYHHALDIIAKATA